MAAKKQGENGCEYAAKISPEKELYIYVSEFGQDCYNATELIINTCWSDKKNDAGWVNSPNPGEFYQAGVRNLNGDGNHHDAITTDRTQFLGHRNVACRHSNKSF